ncbi:hypothetical protein B1218_37925, partial [Pseudomonas ogarae]
STLLELLQSFDVYPLPQRFAVFSARREMNARGRKGVVLSSYTHTHCRRGTAPVDSAVPFCALREYEVNGT